MARADSACGPSHNTILLLSRLSPEKSPKAENHSLSGRPQKQGAECSVMQVCRKISMFFLFSFRSVPGMTCPCVLLCAELRALCHCCVSMLVLLWWLHFTEAEGKQRWSCFRLRFSSLNFRFWLWATRLLLSPLQQGRFAEIKVLWMAQRREGVSLGGL